MSSENNELDVNIFKDLNNTPVQNVNELLELESPPSTPKDKKDEKPRLFSLAQVSLKLNELWSTARECVFGEDYWIPSDAYEVAFFPHELLSAHTIVYPTTINDKKCTSHNSLAVVKGFVKNEPSTSIYHVLYSFNVTGESHRETMSIFRSKNLAEAIDFFRRCEECRVLLRLLDKKKDIRKSIRDITSKFQIHPLWRMVHIAIACCRVDLFSDDGFKYLKSIGYSTDSLINIVSSPEGLTSLMYAIQTNQLPIVKFLLKIGADPAVKDILGNNAMHYASMASVQMLEAVWENEKSKPLINMMNNNGFTPVILAIRNANPRCLATLLGFGAELNIRVAGRNPLIEAVQSKGKKTEVIRTILEASPNLLYEIDEATGNTVLHSTMFKDPLLSLLYLKSKEIDLDAKNKSGQTALHLLTIKGKLSMILTLASYNCDLNAKNQSGNTALNLAVSKNFLLITRLLLCLGADPNIANNQNDSPRHLAAKLGDSNLLQSLIICEARRCPPTKIGCVSSCINEQSVSLQLVRKDSIKTSKLLSPHSSSAIEEIQKIENRDFGEKEYRYNKIQDLHHNIIYEEMIDHLTKLENEGGNKNIINLFSLDGGGIRGLVICQVLIEFEKIFSEPMFPYIDWAAGTSTGALIASGLSLGLSFREIQLIYLRFKDLIFEGWTRPYNSTILETFIKNELGEKTFLSDIKLPRLFFTMTRADCFPVQLEFMRNYVMPLSKKENEELGFDCSKDLPLWKALRRTSAAPTYFSCVDNKYIDGGIIANNPTLDLLSEIQLWNSINKYKNLSNEVQIGCVLSIGTGVIPTIPLDANHLEISANPYTTAIAIKNLGTILVDQVTATEGTPVNRAGSWCITNKTPYFRLSPPIFKEVPMDTKDDQDLTQMMWDCMEYTYRHKNYIEKICYLIKKIGKSSTRKHLFQQFDFTDSIEETETSI